MRRRIAMLALSLALTLSATGAALGLSTAPAQAAGTVCSPWTSLGLPGLQGRVCVSATSGGSTTAWAYLYNGSSSTLSSTISVWINNTILHQLCGTGIGIGVGPGQTMTCSSSGPIWTASPRFASASFYAGGFSVSAVTPWLY